MGSTEFGGHSGLRICGQIPFGATVLAENDGRLPECSRLPGGSCVGDGHSKRVFGEEADIAKLLESLGKPLLLALTKADKLNKSKTSAQVKKLKNLPFCNGDPSRLIAPKDGLPGS